MNPHKRNAYKILSLARLPVPTLPHLFICCHLVDDLLIIAKVLTTVNTFWQLFCYFFTKLCLLIFFSFSLDRFAIILYNSICSQKWRNWQTRRLQVPVVAISCGFKSHLLHSQNPGEIEKSIFRDFCCLACICDICSIPLSICPKRVYSEVQELATDHYCAVGSPSDAAIRFLPALFAAYNL